MANDPLRAVRDDDAQDLFGLLALCWAEFPGCHLDPHGELADLRTPQAAYAGRGGAMWVVEDGRGRVCACMAVDFPEPGVAEFHRLYVRPDRRRAGLGERLVLNCEAYARERGARACFLWSDARFTGSHRLYDRLGYRRDPAERASGDISASREWRFAKPLA